ncbi:hypothetical protein MIND_00256800 [Mycena indigotica]|uniref:Uncharacterized protein n=1 Tax=Mycena indigotica TaxID=2126181 RepID=A0A8H6T614_9AGAR|nr:uncharacterized protein MIND_00256800 [Mycena indigotica]KAF7312433.1 hypothetical protein MIND_00256800 [Mycena indigotica]
MLVATHISASFEDAARSAPPIDFPRLSDASWDDALASTESELAVKRSDGFFLVTALKACILAHLAQSMRLTKAKEDLHEDVLLEPLISLLLQDAGVWERKKDEPERQACRAFFIFADLVVAERGFEEFSVWFNAMFTPIIRACIGDLLRRITVQSPHPSPDHDSTPRIQICGASSREILIALRRRQAFSQDPTSVVPPADPGALASLQLRLGTHSIEPRPSEDSATPVLSTVAQPELGSAFHRPETEPSVTNELLKEAARFIEETIEMHQRGDINAGAKIGGMDKPTAWASYKTLPDACDKRSEPFVVQSASDSMVKNNMSTEKDGPKATEAVNRGLAWQPLPLSSGGMANLPLAASNQAASSHYPKLFEAPLHDDIPPQWFWPNAPTDIFSNPMLTTLAPVLYWS